MSDLAKLREPFPPEQVGQLPRAGITLDYVGHGAVTMRLLDVDPEWNWEPIATDDNGRPLFELDDKGSPVGFWIRLTVCGVTRPGYGSCSGSQFDAEKVLIGDAIRNAAMRFGVALDLWVKGHAEDDEQVSAKDDRGSRGARSSGSPTRSGGRACVICGKSMANSAAKATPKGVAHANCVESDDPGSDGAASQPASSVRTSGPGSSEPTQEAMV